MNNCIAIKGNGQVCGKVCRGGDIRCSTHMRTLQTNGPHTTARKELGYVHRATQHRIITEGDARIREEQDRTIRARMNQDLGHQLDLIRLQHRREMELLIRTQQDEVRDTGVNPDAEAEQRRREQRRQQQQRIQARWINHAVEALNEENDVRQMAEREANRILAEIDRQQAAGRAVQRRELEDFARDNQNVHTSVAVRQTTDMVERILKISVPPEYRWNMSECSKTPGEIIVHCRLTPKGAWQMQAKYCQDEEIYELGKGIYGKVLDGVWQYIKNSADKEDLYKVLKQEMEDNIGMCAQGNLTRLCNILSGYMEGIGVQESPAEILGRKLPLLMDIDDRVERLKQAFNLLIELKIPENQWVIWVEPLIEDGVSVRIKGDAVGRPIGFEIMA